MSSGQKVKVLNTIYIHTSRLSIWCLVSLAPFFFLSLIDKLFKIKGQSSTSLQGREIISSRRLSMSLRWYLDVRVGWPEVKQREEVSVCPPPATDKPKCSEVLICHSLQQGNAVNLITRTAQTQGCKVEWGNGIPSTRGFCCTCRLY